MMIRLAAFFVCAYFTVGCSSNATRVASHTQYKTVEGHATSNMNQDELLYYLLRKEYAQWQGTPFRLGGDNRQGIDCSALVQQIYHDSFSVDLPRTTESQALQGQFVYKTQLQVGDLVFFKTGWNTRHVGIYIGKDEFIHASTSKGVITSSLNNVYWKPKYWQAKRILH